MPSSSQLLDRFEVTFDHDHAVADAGLILPATLAQHLGLDGAAEELVGLGFRPGRKVATVVHGILAGAVVAAVTMIVGRANLAALAAGLQPRVAFAGGPALIAGSKPARMSRVRFPPDGARVCLSASRLP